MRTLLLTLLAVSAAFAQDARRVVSPDGQMEFRLFIAEPAASMPPRLAYLVNYRGKPLVETSFLGFDIRHQEPMLGENVGLVKSQNSTEGRFNTLLCEFMQNGSLGRRIDVEVRAYNDGVAFRYRLPRSAPLNDLYVADEVTEFALANGSKVEGQGLLPFPVFASLDGTGSIGIFEGRSEAGYQRANLEIESGSVLITRLQQHKDDPTLAWESRTPFVFPWRAIIVAGDHAKLAQSPILSDLN